MTFKSKSIDNFTILNFHIIKQFVGIFDTCFVKSVFKICYNGIRREK